MTSYLSEIVAAHRRRAASDRRDLDELVARAEGEPPARPFARVLRAGGTDLGAGVARDEPAGPTRGHGLAVIAEVKRRSPSKGVLAAGLDASAVARAYAAGGAACLSVLTEQEHFGGCAADLQEARRASGLPVLRKDFTVSAADVCDARLMGADAVLLIVAALSDDELTALHALARRVGLDALVEVHDEDELDRALATGAELVGVNQRDLRTFDVDSERALRLAARIPSDVVAVAESGVRGVLDARAFADAGYDAVLVGEAVVTAPDPAAAVRALSGHPVAARGTGRRAARAGQTAARAGR